MKTHILRVIATAAILIAGTSARAATPSQFEPASPPTQRQYLDVPKWTEPLRDDERIVSDGMLVAVVTAAEIPDKTISYRHFANYNLDANVTKAGTAQVGTAGFTLRRLTTTQRDAITCDANTEGQLIYNSSTDAINVCQASAWTAVVAGGGGESLDATYQIGASITLTDAKGAVILTDTQTGGGAGLDINGTANVAAGTHNYISVEGTGTNALGTTLRGLDIGFSGATCTGTCEGIQLTMAAATASAIDIPVGSVTMGASGTLTMTGVGGSTVVAVTAGDAVFSDGSLALTDADNAESFTLINNTAGTSDVASITANGLTSGDALQITSSEAGLTSGCYARFNNGASDDFKVCDDGAVTIAGDASGTDALTITAGDILVSSGHLDLTVGDLTLADGALTVSKGTTTLANDNVGESELIVTCTGIMTQDCVQWTDANTGAVPSWDINISGARNAAGHFFDIDTTSTGTDNVFDARVGAALYDGSLIYLDTGTTSTSALGLEVVGGAVARTSSLVKINNATTDNSGFALEIDSTIARAVDITGASGVTTQLVTINTNGGVNGALLIDDGANGAWAYPLFKTSSGTGTGVADVAQVIYEGDGATDALEINLDPDAAATGNGIFVDGTDSDFQGDGINISLTGANAAANGIVITGQTDATGHNIDVTNASTSSANGLLVTRSGAGATGHGVRADYSGTGTGAAFRGTSTSVTADAGGAKVGEFSYNGALESQGGAGVAASGSAVMLISGVTTAWANDADDTPSYVLNVVQSAGSAAADGDYAVRISASGANVEGLWVDDGLTRFDEAVGVGGTAPTAGTHAFLVTEAAATYSLFDCATTDHTAATAGCIQTTIDSGTANTFGFLMDHEVTADVDNQYGFYSSVAVQDAVAFTNDLASYTSALDFGASSAADTGRAAGFIAGTPANANANLDLAGFRCEDGYTGADDGCLVGIDTALTIREMNTAGNASGIVIAAADGVTNSNGGDLTLAAGDTGSSGAGNGTGGDVIIQLGEDTAGTAGDLTIQGSDNAAGLETWATLNESGWTMANTARRTKTINVAGGDCAASSGSPVFTETGATRWAGWQFDGAADEEITCWLEIPGDLAGSTNIDVDFVYASETGTNDVMWVLEYESVGDADDADDDAGDTAVSCGALTVPAAEVLDIGDCGTDLLAANLTAGEYLRLTIGRNADDAGDTHAADIALVALRLTYTSTRP